MAEKTSWLNFVEGGVRIGIGEGGSGHFGLTVTAAFFLVGSRKFLGFPGFLVGSKGFRRGLCESL